MAPTVKSLEDFRLAVMCTLEVEALAMIRQLDEDKDYGEVFSRDCNFTLGGIGEHNVVVTSLPAGRQGNISAAVAAQQTMEKFKNIEHLLLVGVAGGVPSEKNDIRLGDVVVSFPEGKYGGVVQYDFGKEEEIFKHNGQTNSVPQQLLAYINAVKTGHARFHKRKPKYLEYLDIQLQNDLRRPESRSDRLFPPSYVHQGGIDCELCDEEQAQHREPRERPQVHYGLIASGSRVMKNGEQRDKYNKDHGGIVLAYEMEAAGLMNFTPCLVIKGISDYADSHKPPGKSWHAFAAAVAASYAREFVEKVPSKNDSGTHTAEKQKAYWNVPFGRNKNFVGPDLQLDELMAKLIPEDYENDCQHVAIAGLGGVGKTQIALEAAYRIRQNFPDCAVFWVSAIDMASFECSYLEIANGLQIPGMERDKADVKSLLKAHLSQESAGRWLMIVDNADDVQILFERSEAHKEASTSSALADYLPFNQKGAILVTTRNLKVAIKQAETNIITVPEMIRKESHLLLEKSLVDKTLIKDNKDSTKLLGLLADLPLAIKQAATYINENMISIIDYLDIYGGKDEELIKLLSEEFEDHGRYCGAKNPIATTWLISFTQIQKTNQLAADLLFLMSCVEHRDIPISLLPVTSRCDSTKAIGILKAYAFITARIEAQSFDMHRLVQLAVRNWLEIKGDLHLWRGKTLVLLENLFPVCDDKNSDECTRLIPHTHWILRPPELPEKHKKVQESFLQKIGIYYHHTAKNFGSDKVIQQAIKAMSLFYSMKNIDTILNAFRVTAVTEYDENAKDVDDRCRQQLLITIYKCNLYQISTIAMVLSSYGEHLEAEEMIRKTLQLHGKVLGNDNPAILLTMGFLATVLHHQGRRKEAEEIIRKILKVQEKVLSIEDPDTLKSMGILASVLINHGRYKEGEEIIRKTLQLKENIFGIDHPDTLKSMDRLADVFLKKGEYKKSEKMIRQILQVQEKRLGKDDPETLQCISSLALVLLHQGKYKESEEIIRPTLQLQEKILGIENQDTLGSMHKLALALCYQGKCKEGDEIKRQAKQRETVLHSDHRNILAGMKNLPVMLMSQGKYKEAREMIRKLLTVQNSA